MPEDPQAEAAPPPGEAARVDQAPPAPTESRVTAEGVYRDGTIRLHAPLDLPPETPVSLEISYAAPATEPPATRRRRLTLGLLPALPATGAAFARAEVVLLLLCLLVYLTTRAIGLERFPIYFFTDEAIQVNHAERLLQHGFRDSSGTLLPTYFLNVDKWNLGLSVYVHAISVALFGKSVLVARATSVAVGLLGATAIAVMLKLVFRLRLWWAGVLVLAALPAWFLHSRTAFETVMMVSFYACFLCCYLLYRYRSPWFLWPALLFGAATFYSYANGQGVMLVSGILLLCSDFTYHRRQSRVTLVLVPAMVLILALPYLRFRSTLGDAFSLQLPRLNSYWTENSSLGHKLLTFTGIYLSALRPDYWFWPNHVDLDRHQMKGLGHFSLLALPFALLGLWICIRQWRSPAHRAVLIAVLAAPFSASLVGILVTRVLAMVVPATLLITIGLDWCIGMARARVPYRALAIGCGGLLVLLCAGVTYNALVYGPRWYTNYGLFGMQYGAAQVFGASRDILEQSPETELVFSPNWANNPNAFVEFFVPASVSDRLRMQNISPLLTRKQEISPRQLFVLPQDEYQRVITSPKLNVEPPELVVNLPDGTPGFYFVRLSYNASADDIFAAEQAARGQLEEHTVTLDGQRVAVRLPRLDQGRPVDLFDADSSTLIRGQDANPFVLDVTFPTPRTIRGFKLQTATMDYSLRVETFDGSTSGGVSSASYSGLPVDPTVEYLLPDGASQVTRLRLEITYQGAAEEVHIHVRELTIF